MRTTPSWWRWFGLVKLRLRYSVCVSMLLGLLAGTALLLAVRGAGLLAWPSSRVPASQIAAGRGAGRLGARPFDPPGVLADAIAEARSVDWAKEQAQARNRGPCREGATTTKWIVVTSILPPTPAIVRLAALPDWRVVVVGDRKTPAPWEHPHCVCLSVDHQADLGYRITHLLPEGSYARKNIGYLYAIQHGAQVIYETDDDNVLLVDAPTAVAGDPSTLAVTEAPSIDHHAVFNVYAYFGQPTIWPRGYPLQAISDGPDLDWAQLLPLDATASLTRPANETSPPVDAGVQLVHAAHMAVGVEQGLANGDPDVDAIFRLTRKDRSHQLLVRFGDNVPPLLLPRGVFSPFNSQNTLFHAGALWATLIPISTTFRVCDIWRGYWVQRLLWDAGLHVLFRNATVAQMRNPHDYLNDFLDEADLYSDAGRLVRHLADWQSSQPHLFGRIMDLAISLALEGFWGSSDVKLVQAWLLDLLSVCYEPPAVASAPIKDREPSDAVDATMLPITSESSAMSVPWDQRAGHSPQKRSDACTCRGVPGSSSASTPLCPEPVLAADPIAETATATHHSHLVTVPPAAVLVSQTANTPTALEGTLQETVECLAESVTRYAVVVSNDHLRHLALADTELARSIASLTAWGIIAVRSDDAALGAEAPISETNQTLRAITIHRPERLPLHSRWEGMGPAARKNLGYLIAIHCGAEAIFDTETTVTVDGTLLSVTARALDSDDLVVAGQTRTGTVRLLNPLPYFVNGTAPSPRGYPLSHARASRNVLARTELSQGSNTLVADARVLLAHGHFASGTDVDLTSRASNGAGKALIPGLGAMLSSTHLISALNSWTPINSRNTVVLHGAFWLLYLPSTVSSDAADLWRSVWMQRLLPTIGGRVQLVGLAGAQSLSGAEIYSDPAEPIPPTFLATERMLYDVVLQQAIRFAWENITLASCEVSLDDDGCLVSVIKLLAIAGQVGQHEAGLATAWMRDLHSLGYKVPRRILESDNSMQTSARAASSRSVAVCVTGQCMRGCHALPFVRLLERPDVDVFGFTSTFRSHPEHISFQLRRPWTSNVVYEDTPVAERSDRSLRLRSGISPQSLYQQLYALERCYREVEAHEQETGTRYTWFVRLRTDHVFDSAKEPCPLLHSLLDGPPPTDQAVWIEDPKTSEYIKWGLWSDRLAAGSMAVMRQYMTRFSRLLRGEGINATTYHAEKFMQWDMRNNLKYQIRFLENCSNAEVPHTMSDIACPL